jgi:UDP-glucose 4-epimerase
MNILVTGGAGFIGSHLVDRLLTDGHDVVVIDNCSTGSEANLAAWSGEPRLHFVRGSVLHEDLVASVTADVDLVYHLAAVVGVTYVIEDPLGTILTNTRGTEIVLAAAARHGTRVLFASTSEIYGLSEDLPFREDGRRVLGPTWIHRWSYSTSKALDEHLCFAWHDRGLPVSIVRYFNIYGPRMDPAGYGSVIARFLSQAQAGTPLSVHGDGEQTRCFTFVDEAVEATVRAATRREALGEAINVGSGDEITVNDLARSILRLTASAAPIAHVPYVEAYGRDFHDTRRRVPDVSKAAALLGWRAAVPLDEGLARTLAAWNAKR